MRTVFVRLLLLSMLLPVRLSFASGGPPVSGTAAAPNAAMQQSTSDDSKEAKRQKKEREKQEKQDKDKKKKKTAEERDWERKLMGIYG